MVDIVDYSIGEWYVKLFMGLKTELKIRTTSGTTLVKIFLKFSLIYFNQAVKQHEYPRYLFGTD